MVQSVFIVSPFGGRSLPLQHIACSIEQSDRLHYDSYCKLRSSVDFWVLLEWTDESIIQVITATEISEREHIIL